MEGGDIQKSGELLFKVLALLLSGARAGSPSLPGSHDPLFLLAFRCCAADSRRVSSRPGANSNRLQPQPNLINFQGDKNHPYSQIMRDWYQRLKESGNSVPKVLGLSACLVVKGTTELKFRQNKQELEQVGWGKLQLQLNF